VGGGGYARPVRDPTVDAGKADGLTVRLSLTPALTHQRPK
jgi:hypothetical protein